MWNHIEKIEMNGADRFVFMGKFTTPCEESNGKYTQIIFFFEFLEDTSETIKSERLRIACYANLLNHYAGG